MIHIVCPKCNGTNRIPNNPIPDEAKCGRCKQLLFDTHPITLDTQNLNQHLQKNDIPVLIDFWAPWCGPCQAMGPNFEKAATYFKKRVRFAKVNTQEQESIAAHYAIRSIPTLILFKQGRIVDQISGALDSTQLQAWLNNKI